MKRKIAITGGIGTGKSTAAARLRMLGAAVLSADEAAREVLLPGSPGLKQVVGRFGEGVLQKDGTLDRKRLGAIVFAAREERLALNAIMHPLINSHMAEREAHYFQENDAPLFLEIPLLYELGMQHSVDEIWLVTAREQVRIARIMRRDRCTRGAALARIASQLPQEEKQKHADVVIDNSGTVQALLVKIDALYKALMDELREAAAAKG